MTQTALLWLTPKVFPDVEHPEERVAQFYDHYAQWFEAVDETVLVVATGNGDHILNYRGPSAWNEPFDWARYNSYAGPAGGAHPHNARWVARVREGGERSSNPYQSGPTFILSDQVLDCARLARIYRCLREEGRTRGLSVRVLEYLEPGPEFCACVWKTRRHPEAAHGTLDAGGTVLPGLLDVVAPLAEDRSAYAGFPAGVPRGMPAGEFVARQCACFTRDLDLDGILLGNQFGLINPWFPDDAVEPTPQRRAGISAFFRRLREEMGDRLVYWMDSYWPPAIEESAWGMDPANYACLDAVLCSTFAVLVERTQIVPNVEGRLALSRALGGPRVLYSLDFVDPWYWYRTYLDDIRTYTYQRDVYGRLGAALDGVSFFANDTFGLFVPRGPLDATFGAVRSAWAGPASPS